MACLFVTKSPNLLVAVAWVVKFLGLNAQFDCGCISLGKILIRILNPKTDILFLWQNPKKDYESNESVRDEDLMD